MGLTFPSVGAGASTAYWRRLSHYPNVWAWCAAQGVAAFSVYLKSLDIAESDPGDFIS